MGKMLSFKKFKAILQEAEELEEANLGSHPDNYPEGSVVRLNKPFVIGPYKEGTLFTVLFIGPEKDKNITQVYPTKVSTTKKPVWIGLQDESGDKFQVMLSKSLADSYFLKGSKTRGGETTSVIFANKELTPDSLGFADKTLTSDGIISLLETNKKLKPEEKKFLVYLAKTVNGKGSSFFITVPEKFLSELNVISKDFGEILSAIWLLNNETGLTKIKFPDISNLPFIDLYGVSKKTLEPYSVKSEGGSKVSIGNILDSIDDVIKNPTKATGIELNFTTEESEIISSLRKIISLSMKDGMIEGHRILQTDAIKELSKVMNVPVAKITNKKIDEWAKNKTAQQLKKQLSTFYTKANSRPTEKMFESGREPNRLIVGPLGESLRRELNIRKPYLDVLNKIANLVEASQVNISIKPKTITFSLAKFRDAKFVFGWAGYSGGNKLGFIKTKS